MFYLWASVKAVQLFIRLFFFNNNGMFHSSMEFISHVNLGNRANIRADQSDFLTTFFSQLVTVTKLPIGVVGVFN